MRRDAYRGWLVNYRTGAVRSADGTEVTHRIIGDRGPAIVLVHGGLQAAQNFQRLAEHLSARFVVYVPDRRGRRPGVPAGSGYGLECEGQDLDALVRAVGARQLFGLSSGATIALYTALEYPGIEKLALYEPPLTIDGADPAYWVPDYERAVAAGNLASALTEVLKGTAGRDWIPRLPRFVLVPLLRVAIEIDAAFRTGENLSLRELIPTMHLDSIVQHQSIEMVNPRLPELRSDLLLLGGEKSMEPLGLGLDAIAKRLPNAQRVELTGVGHVAADNRGDPAAVARILDRFFDV